MKAIRFIQTILFFSICALTANGQSSYFLRVENDSLKPSSGGIYTLDAEFNDFMDAYAVKIYEAAYSGNARPLYRLVSDSTIPLKVMDSFSPKGISVTNREQLEREIYKSFYLIKVDDDKLKPIGNGIFTQNEEFNAILELYKAGVYQQYIQSEKDGWLKDVYQLRTENELPIEILKAFIGRGFSLVEEDTWDPQTTNDMGLQTKHTNSDIPLIYYANSHSVCLNIPLDIKVAKLYLYGTQGGIAISQKITERGANSIDLNNNAPAGVYSCILLCDGKVVASKQIVITD